MSPSIPAPMECQACTLANQPELADDRGLQPMLGWRSITWLQNSGNTCKGSLRTPSGVCAHPHKEGELQRWGGCFCALSLFIKGRQVASIFHAVPGVASALLPSSLPAPASGGAGKAEQLLLGSASLPGSWAPVLTLMSCSLGDLR